MEHVYNSNRLQTLQIYRKPDKIPSESRFKKLEEELRQVRIRYPMPTSYRHPEKEKDETLELEAPKIKSIELQNKMRRLDNQLSMCVNDFRDMIDRFRELDRLLPKNHHDLNSSEEEAREYVDKIVKFDEIKKKVLDEYESICLRYEEYKEQSKTQIRNLETKQAENESKIDSLEFELNKIKRHMKN